MAGSSPGMTRGTNAKEQRHDLRIACLSHDAGQAIRALEAFRRDHAENLGTPRHPSGGVLDDTRRRIERRPHLYAEMGIAGRAREKMGFLPGPPRMAWEARRDREGRPDQRAG